MTACKRNRRLAYVFSVLVIAAAGGCSDWGGKRVMLFDGKDLNGWKALDPAHNAWQVAGNVELDPADISKLRACAETVLMPYRTVMGV